jgi:hypothetical protein
MTTPARDVVFISHAKPEDNDLVLWLGSRLVGEGYKAWAELLHLDGGSPFWADIEQLIRNNAVRVISLVSRHSIAPDRRGFRNELSIADGVGRKLGDSKFIIPLRVDETPEHDFPAQVQQLHALDFSKGWGQGYVELLQTLERSGITRDPSVQSEAFAQWRTAHSALPSMVANVPETAVSNLLTVTKMPSSVSIYSFEGNRETFPAALKASGVPHSHFHRLFITLAGPDGIRESLPSTHAVKLESNHSVDDFLDGPQGNETRPTRPDAKNKLTAIIREHIEVHLRRRGLIEFDASGQRAFYFPKGLVENDKVHYRTAWDAPTRKNVVGRSEKLGVYWHLAMKVNVAVGDETIVRFKPYICWSEDGTKALEAGKRTASLRKRFCKNWWNPHWRGLQEAFVTFLAEGEPSIAIDLGGGRDMALSASLETFQLARSMPGDLLLIDEPDSPAEPVDVEEEAWEGEDVGEEA